MKTRIWHVLGVVVCMAGLAGCGVDGAPTRPEPRDDRTPAVAPGGTAISVTGQASIGVSGGSR